MTCHVQPACGLAVAARASGSATASNLRARPPHLATRSAIASCHHPVSGLLRAGRSAPNPRTLWKL